MIKVFMLPTPEDSAQDTTNAINQIVLRLAKHLPKYGVEIVSFREQADLVVGHAGQIDHKQVDVAHCHGLYPTSDSSITSGWHWGANMRVITNLTTAKVITVPSEWVADILRRDMHIDPCVIGWAIDPEQWEPGINEGYVLWNKTRTDGVCTPDPLIELASRVPNVRFLTTFGEGTPNIKTTGRVSFETMRQMIRNAGVYLATTKETFGISTLEAMAAGVPVLGYRHGGTADIVQHGETGYLVAPGDLAGLVDGLHYCLKHREILGENARAVALTYTWDRVASCFAQIYHNVLQEKAEPKVSVVIPCYNYSAYVEQAMLSVLEQKDIDFELIVVNDGSADNSQDVISEVAMYAHENIGVLDRNITLLYQSNAGVAEARNAGIRAARGKYIVCLDADDKLNHSHFLRYLSDSLDSDPRLGIVFTGLQIMDVDGNVGNMADWPRGYDFDRQVQGHNQIPTCCMFKREAWQRAGGYRKKYTPAEDAELWLRIGSLGYHAMQVTTEGWFLYRLHSSSLSSVIRTGQKKEPDWRGDKAWIASGNRPFASDGQVRFSWPVRNYDRPRVSVIIPVSQYHTQCFRDAVDSIESQTELYWECIVVNDSGEKLNFDGMPYVRLIDTGGGAGASVARNLGIAAARAHFVTFLDADDVFEPRFLEKTIRMYAIHSKYVYTDWNSFTKDGRLEKHETPEFDPVMVFRQTSIHSINILIPKVDLYRVGLFDETMTTWEDVDLFMKLAAAGICGVRVPEPLVTYRYQSGQLRERGERSKADLLKLLRDRYSAYMTGETIPVCNCTTAKTGIHTNSDASREAIDGGDGLIRVLYNGPMASHEVIGFSTKKRYGWRENGDTFFVFSEDYEATPDLFVPIADLQLKEETPIPPAPMRIVA